MFNENGQSLMEVVVALTVGILVVTALTFATLFSVRNAGFSKASVQATKLAQEGLERVRSGRDKNALITNNFKILGIDINDWNDPDLWSNQISPSCGGCQEYFKVNVDGKLQYLLPAPDIPSNAEKIGQFQRAIILSETQPPSPTQKQVTAVVRWTDTSGPHESKLTTILGRL